MFAPGVGRYLLLGIVAVVVGTLVVGITASYVWMVLFAPLLGLLLFLAVFFRDPERVAAPGVVSAADGRVQSVEREGDRLRIAVFMNVTNVHVNRAPVEGVVRAVVERGSGFRPAYRADAAHNLQRSYEIDSPLGAVEVVQMTGIVARRLVSFVRAKSRVGKAERIGMIVLGSRVDVFLPAARVRPTVAVGMRVRAGSSTIAEVIG